MSARNDYTHFLNVFNVNACLALMYCEGFRSGVV